MPSTFTPINGRASASTAAVARAGDHTPARRRQTPGPINGTERERRRSPTTPDAIRRQVQLQKLSAEMRDPAFTWPAGITSSNAVVADINNRGVPGALAHQGKNCSSDVLKFIWCASESRQWPHGKTAACLGRSELAIRIILCKMRKKAIQIQRGVDRMRQMVRPQPGEPSSSSPSPGEQSDRPVPREPPTQTSFEAQPVADQLPEVSEKLARSLCDRRVGDTIGV
jgi:hypothetical protein